MEKLTFKNSEGLRLVGVLHTPIELSQSAVIIVHGFTSNKDRKRFIYLSDAFACSGITSFRIDLGGSGESEDREIAIVKQMDDLRSAVSFLQSKGYLDIGVLGESLGGMVALRMYNEDIKAMVLWAPVTKARQVTGFSKEELNLLKRNGYFIKEKNGKSFKIPQTYIDEREEVNREKILGNIKIPVMIIHGTADQLIPLRDSEEAIGLFPKGSKLERIENWEHGGFKMNEKMEVIIPKTVNWFKEHLISKLDEENTWEAVVDFTKTKKEGISIEELNKRTDKDTKE